MDLEKQEDIEVKESTDVIKCPKCGSNMTYNPTKQGLFCEYCEHVVEVKGVMNAVEVDFLTHADSIQKWDKETRTFHCSNCGANTVFSHNEIATVCPFCSSANVSVLKDEVGIKPTSIVPFKQPKTEIKAIFHKWIKAKIYAPKSIKKDLPDSMINGVYLPFWTYDTNTISKYNGRVGQYYYVTVGSGKNARTERRTRWFNISGHMQKFFDDILVPASKRLEQKVVRKMGDYQTNSSIVYDSRFLAGYSAERYEKTLLEGWDVAKVTIYNTLKNDIIRKHNADVVDYISIFPTYNNTKFKYVLLPIWICSFQYQEKTYHFYVNGFNNRIHGSYPVSTPKILFTIFFVILLIVGFYFLARTPGFQNLINNLPY
jgi:Zn finger protein HypA/HybF involved in hydrogenase expression